MAGMLSHARVTHMSWGFKKSLLRGTSPCDIPSMPGSSVSMRSTGDSPMVATLSSTIRTMCSTVRAGPLIEGETGRGGNFLAGRAGTSAKSASLGALEDPTRGGAGGGGGRRLRRK